MTAYTIKVTASGGINTRGASSSTPGMAALSLGDGDSQDVLIDWEPWLNGDTIASITNTGSTATVTTKSSDTTSATLTIAGTSGHVQHQVTTASGAKKSVFITINGNSDFMDREYAA